MEYKNTLFKNFAAVSKIQIGDLKKRTKMKDISTLYLTQGSGNSFKPALIARQLNIECNKKYIDVLSGETRKSEFLAINRQGVVPYMTLNNGSGIGESNAIAWYLAEGSALMPNTETARAQTVRWMNFEQSALECNISPARFFTTIVPEAAADHQDMFPLWHDRGNAGLEVLNDHLNQNDFITEHGYSVADVAVFGYTHLADEGGFDLSKYPAVNRWIERVGNQKLFLPVSELLDGVDLDNHNGIAA